MKKIVPIVVLGLAVMLSSCLDTQSHYTPQVSVSNFVNGAGDTLEFRYDGMSNLFNLDSLLVGDTLKGAVGFASLGNNLLSAHVDWDTAALSVWSAYTEEMIQVMIAPSDTTNIDIYLPLGYNYVGLPLWIVPKRNGSTLLKFTVTTDSKFSPANEILQLNAIND